MKYLYHYTSIDKLALIMKTRTIKFTNLLNVDDPEEAETEDLGKAGKHCLVSCWTDNKEDSIPMWNMYTPEMKGVRLRMRPYPFKQYIYDKGTLHFSETVKSYINYNGEYAKKVNIAPECPLLEKIEYTDDENLIKPQIVKQKEGQKIIFFGDVGRCKRKYWEFQQEYRYIIRTAPWSTEELEQVQTPEEHIQIFNRILDETNNQYCDEIFLVLSDDAFENAEILLGPKTSDIEYIIVEALLEKYCKGKHIELKKSKIKVR